MTAIVTGLTPLLNLCSSGIIPKTDKIHYLLYQNTWRADWVAPTDNRTAHFAREIGDSLGYDVVIHGPYKWHCSPDRIEYEEPRVSLESENVVSDNALLFLEGQLRGKSIESFPEGASCFRRVLGYASFLRKWRSRCNYHVSRIKKGYNVDRYWILPDYDGIINAKINFDDRFKVLPALDLYRGYDLATNFLIKKYPEIDFSNHQNAFFHPIAEQICPDNYLLWLDAQKGLIGDSTLILKYKGRSARYLTNKIVDKNIIFVPDEFSIIPGEIIIRQSKMSYLGLLSSLLLAFPRERVHLIPAPDEKIRLKNQSTHSHLADILSLSL
jgi:hypothetical protein